MGIANLRLTAEGVRSDSYFFSFIVTFLSFFDNFFFLKKNFKEKK